MNQRVFSALAGLPLLFAAAPLADDEVSVHAVQGAADEAIVAAQAPSYPFSHCIVSLEPFPPDGAIDLIVGDRLVRTCCKGCIKMVKKDSDAVLAEIDAAVIAQQKPDYPLETCPLCGNELGEEAQDVVVGTRLVRACCESCAAKVREDPAAAMPKVDAAWIAAQVASYPLDTCVVSGDPLPSGDGGEKPVDHLYGVQLVRFCCAGCEKPFAKSPMTFLAKIAEAKRGG